jgi:hypothetical protein
MQKAIASGPLEGVAGEGLASSKTILKENSGLLKP